MALRIKAKQQLQNFMDYYGLTPPELACRMAPPIERQTVMRWCDGTRRPSVEYQQQLLDMSGGKIQLSGWLTDKELAKEKIRASWFKKYPVQLRDGGKPNGHSPAKAKFSDAAKSNKNNGQKLVGSKNSNGQSTAPEHNGAVHGADGVHGAGNDFPIKRKPGRPKGSKNRPRADVHAAGNGLHEGVDGASAKTRTGSRARSARTNVAADSKNGKSGEASESAGGGEAVRTVQGPVGNGASHLRLVDSGSAGSVAGSATGRDGTGRELEKKNSSSEMCSTAGSNDGDTRDAEPQAEITSEACSQAPIASPETHEIRKTSDEPDTKPTVIAKPTGPTRKSHAECSSDDPMTRMQMRKDGAIQFELVDATGLVLACYQDVVSARNALDSRIHPTSHAARCKFCWTEVSVYTPPRPEITERLARTVTEAQPRRNGRDGGGRDRDGGGGERESGNRNRMSRERREDRESEDQDVG